MNHPEDALASYVDGVATLQERASVEAHLAFCPRCREDIERARAARTAVSSLPEMPAPEGTAAAVLAAAAGLGLDVDPPSTAAPDAPSTAAPDSPATAAPAATPPPRPTAPRRSSIRAHPQAPRVGHRFETGPAAPVPPPVGSPAPPPVGSPGVEAPESVEPAAGIPVPPPAESETGASGPSSAEPETRVPVPSPAAPEEAPSPEEPDDGQAGRPAPHAPSVRPPTAAYRSDRRLRLVRVLSGIAAVLVVVALFGLAVHFAGGRSSQSTAGGGTAAQAPNEAAGKGASAGGIVHDQQNFSSASFASFARELAAEARRKSLRSPVVDSPPQRTTATDAASPSTPRDQALACLQQGTGLVHGTAPFYVEQASYGGEPVYVGAFVTTSTGGRRSLLVMAVTVDGCQARQLVHQAL